MGGGAGPPGSTSLDAVSKAGQPHPRPGPAFPSGGGPREARSPPPSGTWGPSSEPHTPTRVGGRGCRFTPGDPKRHAVCALAGTGAPASRRGHTALLVQHRQPPPHSRALGCVWVLPFQASHAGGLHANPAVHLLRAQPSGAPRVWGETAGLGRSNQHPGASFWQGTGISPAREYRAGRARRRRGSQPGTLRPVRGLEFLECRPCGQQGNKAEEVAELAESSHVASVLFLTDPTPARVGPGWWAG